MDIYEEILQTAKSLCGGADTHLPLICTAVAKNLQARLRSGVSVEECRDSFVYAAALMTLSIIRTVDNDQLSGFDAGTLKLNFTDRTDQLATLANRLLAPWYSANDFAFRGVNG